LKKKTGKVGEKVGESGEMELVSVLGSDGPGLLGILANGAVA